MKPITKTKLESDWIEKENIEFMQKRHRRYLHFDRVIDFLTDDLYQKIVDVDFVSSYSFFPLIRRVSKTRLYKKDPSTGKTKIRSKERDICYASHFDALIYSWYAHQLSFKYEDIISNEELNTSVIAYRKLEKSNLDFAKEVFDFIALNQECVAIAFDIKGFYDTLDHALLKRVWCSVLDRKDLPDDHYAIYKAVTKFSYVDIEEIIKALGFKQRRPKYEDLKVFFNSELINTVRSKNIIVPNRNRGVPQGAPISCVLSNMYMLEFDRNLIKKVEEFKGMYRRYSDDIIIVCPDNRLVEVKEFIKEEIKKIKLVIEDTKTEIRFFKREKSEMSCKNEKGEPSKLQYLGVNFDGEKFTLRHKGYAKFERRMSNSVKNATKRADKFKRGVSKKALYERYTPLGAMNYITYARRAANTLKAINILNPVRSNRLFKKIKQKILTTKKKLAE